MLYEALLFALGLVLICAGGDKLVDAAVSISERIGIPHIVVGATIVSFCTTMPEMLVSTTAIINGSAAISVGNAFGSIICNTGLIAGISLLFRPSASIDVRELVWRCAYFLMIIALLFGLGLGLGFYNMPVGIALLVLFAAYALLSIHSSGNGKAEDSGEENTQDEEKQTSMLHDIATILICAVLLFAGANLLVNHGITLARYLGIPERAIAVTAIALGTSLPELVTTIMSLVKKYENIGIGNVVGANILNLLLVIGIPSTFSFIPLEESTVMTDIPLAMAVMLILTVPILIWKRSSRVQGILLLAIYFGYCAMAL